MAANQSAAPIIIKKVKKGGHGHHGGAWKVAFADFVTAMMAFFLLMWLVNATTVQQKAAISAYFNDPLATTGYSGNGAGNPALDGGSGILAGRGENPFTAQSTNEDHTTTSGPSEEQIDEEALERARMISMLEELKGVIDAGKALGDFADQILFDITPEGLRIQIVDKENRAMFDQGSAHLKDHMRDILREIVKVISEAPNRISVSGHTDATPYANGGDYSNWELSADRANAARRELLQGGLTEEKIGRVVGLGPSDLLDPSQPEAPINRRISIVVLRGDHGKLAAAGQPATAAAVDGASPAADVTDDAPAPATAVADSELHVEPAASANADGATDQAATTDAAAAPAP